MRCTKCADFYSEKIKTEKCLRNTAFLWFWLISFSLTDFVSVWQIFMVCQTECLTLFFNFQEVCKSKYRATDNILCILGNYPLFCDLLGFFNFLWVIFVFFTLPPLTNLGYKARVHVFYPKFLTFIVDCCRFCMVIKKLLTTLLYGFLA
jgi:hypothetical protein